VHRGMCGIAIGVVAAVTVVAIRPDVNRGRSAEDVRVDEQRAAWAAIDERIHARCEVAAALVRGELTIPQAVARFQDLLADDPAAQRGLWAKYPDASMDELAARQAVGFVAQSTAGDAARRDDLVRQLSALAPGARTSARRADLPASTS